MNAAASLTVDQTGDLLASLRRSPDDNMLLAGLLAEFGPTTTPTTHGELAQWHGYHADGALTAAVTALPGGVLVCSHQDRAAASALTSRLHESGFVPSVVLGPTEAAETYLSLLGEPPEHKRRYGLYSVSADDMGPFTNPKVRLAETSDVPALTQLAVARLSELWECDSRSLNATRVSELVSRRVLARRTYLYEDGGRPVFTVDVLAESTMGAVLGMPYTIPEARRQGHATLSLGQIARHLLSSTPRLVVFVSPGHDNFARVARRVGFNPASTWMVAARTATDLLRLA